MTGHSPPFALVLAIWGTRYGAQHVNEIAASAFRLSPGLAEVVLMTDRMRDGIDPRVRQKVFPAPYGEPAFFGTGYRAKLAVFAAVAASPGMPCVFLDLDSIVVGDLGRIADLVRQPDDLFMLPPAGLGFGVLRRAIDRIRGGRHFPIGNSSVLAFHSAASPNLSTVYARRYREGALEGGWSPVIDDILISWFGRGRIRPVPTGCAVMLRREFLSRIPFWAVLKSRLPWVRKRRALLAAVTMNGINVKAEMLADLPEGAVLRDGRGRHGRWDATGFGRLWQPLRTASRRIAHPGSPHESD